MQKKKIQKCHTSVNPEFHIQLIHSMPWEWGFLQYSLVIWLFSQHGYLTMNMSNAASSHLIEKNIPYANTTVIILLSCVKCREGKFPCPLILTQCLLNVPLTGVIIRFPRKETFVVRQERWKELTRKYRKVARRESMHCDWSFDECIIRK